MAVWGIPTYSRDKETHIYIGEIHIYIGEMSIPEIA